MDDLTQFRFSMVWRSKGPSGEMADYAEPLSFEDLTEARRAHGHAMSGRWVKASMFDAHVTSLRVFKQGRLLPESLADGGDIATSRSEVA